MPAGLRHAHRIAAGTWGRIDVHDGRLRYAAAITSAIRIELGPGATQAIPPGVEHEVEPLGAVRFSIEFFAVDRAGRPNGRSECRRSEPREPADEGGDPACWAGLVCTECGAITDGGFHHAGCPATGANEMTGLFTAWSEEAGLGAPDLNAPMGGVAGGRLATAVSAAGGLGMIGVGSAGSTKTLETEARHPREAGASFGIGLIDWAIQRDPSLLDTAIAARPVLISVSFGNNWSWVDPVHAAGIVAATQVYDADQARQAADAGIEVLVARGAEGGGHGQPTIGTLPLLESVLYAVDGPVLAAGGISTGRGIAAALAAGASGVWLGTAFAACPESLISDPGAPGSVACLWGRHGGHQRVRCGTRLPMAAPISRTSPAQRLHRPMVGKRSTTGRRPRRANRLGGRHLRRQCRGDPCQRGPGSRIS